MDELERVSITEMKRHLGRYIDRVEQGESFVITRYGKDVAVLCPVEWIEALRRLEGGRPFLRDENDPSDR